ncbi:protein kinase superfamily protein [Actinidia rufa]|uniref:Protein kinase superfamily protein n=1 Tax=Actinidia rufa TaxID=165716 RepID=A0A7J0GM79_9ERIC|nr:protein kinase superfamily protein [Actinidia rufa]
MGCVLGTAASGDVRRDINRSSRHRRKTERSSEAGGDTVRVREDRVDEERDRKRKTGGVPTPERMNPKPQYGLKTVQGWPSWLCDVAGDAVKDWTPRRANTFEKLDKIGQGTYSNVYKARDLITGKIVALKKVRFDNLEPESLKFMAREILVLRKLDHPNVIKLEGLVTSRMSSSLYLVFEYMEHDLSGLAAVQEVKFTEPQVKCYMKQLLSGLEHCHNNELLAGKPIMPGRTEVEQLHKIFKLCGSPSEEYWKKSRLPNATLFKPQQPYKRCISETFKNFPPSSLPLIETLLAIDPEERGSSTEALNSEFFTTEPYACEPSNLPKYPPSKEMDVKLRDEEARRQRGLSGKSHVVDGNRRMRPRDRVSRAVPAPEANAELQTNLDRWRVLTQANGKSKSEKFPPPHQDGAVGHPPDKSHNAPLSFGAPDTSFGSSIFESKSSSSVNDTATTGGGPSRKRRTKKEGPRMVPSRRFIRAFIPSAVALSMDFRLKGKGSVSEVFPSRR